MTRICRRKFLEYMGAVMVTPVLAGSQEGSGMYGLVTKMTVVPGKREEMIGILKESAVGMPGCFAYVVAKDAADENAIWVTEVWESITSHDASLSLPSVKNAILGPKRSFRASTRSLSQVRSGELGSQHRTPTDLGMNKVPSNPSEAITWISGVLAGDGGAGSNSIMVMTATSAAGPKPPGEIRVVIEAGAERNLENTRPYSSIALRPGRSSLT